MHQPQQRASRLRVIALASTVALAVALPLAAAVAGEDARLAAEAKAAREPHPPKHAVTPGAAPSHSGERAHRERSREEQAGPEAWDDKSLARLGVPQVTGAAGSSRPSSSCGPEITSPEGVEAQTCVLTEGRDTWARTYYRNATNSRLGVVLTLMRPDGRTTQVRCPVPAADEPGVCETPRHTARWTGGAEKAGGAKPYAAVAEVASADGERLLLRAGSNSPKNNGS
ncbi:hypothetical protein [Streptomyces iconiensis]|uniref:Uncharacterized protein n=1 Tax=Streptomyces iconiensis TaxID=1384038 RepID=A0ABT7A6C5_9ACTN|nr:hypothetical protein [Streptomyces iconiensis]MDJ1136183.1 hypothetical protein [Streptomyces iconiensis]